MRSVIDQVDLVGNDSGGGIAQIFAASLYPERVRSLTLTDCDAHDNWPPEAFKPFLAMAAAGGLRGHAGRDAGGQEHLSLAAGAWVRPMRIPDRSRTPISKPICARW